MAVRTGDREVFSATVPLTLPEYYREDYGRRIEGIGGRRRGVVVRGDVEDRPAAAGAASRIARGDALRRPQRPRGRADRRAADQGVAAIDRRGRRADAARAGPRSRRKTSKCSASTITASTRRPTRRACATSGPTPCRRLSKPFDLPAGKNQPLWVLVHVPKDARPGDYAGTLDAEGRGLVGRRAAAVARLELRPAGAEPPRNRLRTVAGQRLPLPPI